MDEWTEAGEARSTRRETCVSNGPFKISAPEMTSLVVFGAFAGFM